MPTDQRAGWDVGELELEGKWAVTGVTGKCSSSSVLALERDENERVECVGEGGEGPCVILARHEDEEDEEIEDGWV